MNTKPKRITLQVVAIWAFVGVLWAIDYWLKRAFFLRAAPISLWLSMRFCLLLALIWAALTPLVTRAFRKIHRGKWRIWKAIAAHVVLSLVFATSVEVIWAILNLPMRPRGVPRRLYLPAIRSAFLYDFSMNMLAYFAIVASAWGIDSARRLRDRETNNASLQVELARKELEALKTQLRPHFLFNSLNSIVPLIYRDPEAASRMVVCLADLLRLSLQTGSSQLVPLRREIEALRLYVEIETKRFPGRLDVSFQVEPETLAAQVPGLLLQPILENAVRHGVMARPGAGVIEVRTAVENGFLAIRIRDDGPGLRATSPHETTRGVGIANCRARLSLLYGNRHIFDLRNLEPGGAEALIRLPLVLAAEEQVQSS